MRAVETAQSREAAAIKILDAMTEFLREEIKDAMSDAMAHGRGYLFEGHYIEWNQVEGFTSTLDNSNG